MTIGQQALQLSMVKHIFSDSEDFRL